MKQFAILLLIIACTAIIHIPAFGQEQIKIESYPHLGNSPVYDILLDSKGNKWVATADSLVVIKEGNKIRRLPCSTGGFAIAFDKEEVVWSALRNQLVFNARTGKKFPFVANGLSQSSALIIRGDKMLMGTAKGVRVFRYEVRENGFLLEEMNNYFTGHYPRKLVNDLLFDENGSLWIAAENGLFKVSGNNSELIHPYPSTAIILHKGSLYCSSFKKIRKYENMKKWRVLDDQGKMSGNRIEDLAFDSKGNLWMASNKIGLLDTEGKCHVFSTGDGFESKHALSIAVDKDDHVWVGTEGKGIFEIYFEDLSDDPAVVRRYEFMGDHPHNNLVLLLDVSSSMKAPHKLPQLRRAVGALAKNMRPEDEITIVSFSGNGSLILPATSAFKVLLFRRPWIP